MNPAYNHLFFTLAQMFLQQGNPSSIPGRVSEINQILRSNDVNASVEVPPPSYNPHEFIQIRSRVPKNVIVELLRLISYSIPFSKVQDRSPISVAFGDAANVNRILIDHHFDYRIIATFAPIDAPYPLEVEVVQIAKIL
jgi:hypothetical protein